MMEHSQTFRRFRAPKKPSIDVFSLYKNIRSELLKLENVWSGSGRVVMTFATYVLLPGLSPPVYTIAALPAATLLLLLLGQQQTTFT